MGWVPTLYGPDKDHIPYIDQGTKPRIIRAKKWESLPILSGPEKEKDRSGIPVLYGLSEENYSRATALFGQEFVENLSKNKVESKALMKVGLSSKGKQLGLKAKADGIYTPSGMKICGRFLIY